MLVEDSVNRCNCRSLMTIYMICQVSTNAHVIIDVCVCVLLTVFFCQNIQAKTVPEFIEFDDYVRNMLHGRIELRIAVFIIRQDDSQTYRVLVIISNYFCDRLSTYKKQVMSNIRVIIFPHGNNYIQLRRFAYFVKQIQTH